MKTTGGLLIVLLCAVSLAGCIRATGPCYGVGCHAFTTPSGSQAQNAAAPAQNAQATASRPKSKAAQKSHGLHALLKKIKL